MGTNSWLRMRRCLDAIVSKNAQVNAVVSLENHTRLLERASAADEGASVSSTRVKNTILHGMPVLVKDTIDVTGHSTTSGSKKYRDFKPKHDAEVVRRLKMAGALIMGKTNTPEMAMDVQTFNAGGSSGGSAAAVACGMCQGAIGSDFAGSLRIPAAYCGVVSLKPTAGRVPLSGHFPQYSTRAYDTCKDEERVDTGPTLKRASFRSVMEADRKPIFPKEWNVGPMARDVSTIIKMSQAILEDPSDGSFVHDGYEYPLSRLGWDMDKCNWNSANGEPRKPKIAITPSFTDVETDSRIVKAMSEDLPAMLEGFCDVSLVPVPSGVNWTRVQQAHRLFADEVGLAYPRKKKALGKTTSVQLYFNFGYPQYQNKAQHVQRLPHPMYKDSRDKSPSLSQYYTAMETREHILGLIEGRILGNSRQGGSEYDAWVVPAVSCLPFEHNYDHKPIVINGRMVSYWQAMLPYCTIFSLSGSPVVTLTFGRQHTNNRQQQNESVVHNTKGKPSTASIVSGGATNTWKGRYPPMGIGIQVVGRRWEDERLLAVCLLMEQAMYDVGSTVS